MSDPRVLARFSELVYELDAGRSNLPAGWEFLRNSAEEGVPTTNGYFGAAYRNTVTQEIVIAHRGTEKFSLNDWTNNLASLLGKIPGQFQDARQFDARVRDLFLSGSPSTSIEQVGHSLGGGLATMVAAHKGVRS